MIDMTPEQAERLAILIHEDYYAKQALRGLSQEIKYPTWESLPPTLKRSNLRQATTIPDKLNRIGCYLGTADQPGQSEQPGRTDQPGRPEQPGRTDQPGQPGQEVDSFSEEEIERLAEYEHELWTKEREGNGWVLAPEKDSAKKETPFMVAYDELTEDIKELDRDAVRNIIPLVRKIGLKVLRSIPEDQNENQDTVCNRDRRQPEGRV
jgi:hypothetical protein